MNSQPIDAASFHKKKIATVKLHNRSDKDVEFELFGKRNRFDFLPACYQGCQQCDVTIEIENYVQPYIDFFETILSTSLIIKNIVCKDDNPMKVFIKTLEKGRVIYRDYKEKNFALDGEQTIF